MLGDGELEAARHARPGQACVPFQHHLVRYDRRGRVVGTRLLVEVCNDGYGASGVGRDSFEVGPNRFSHTQVGGSAWRWSSGKLLQLWPERVLETSTGSYYFGSRFIRRWSFETQTGTARWALQCNPNDDRVTPPERFAVMIPVVARGSACAAQVDAADTRGLVVYGGPGQASDARMRVALTLDGLLQVEVSDDTLVRSKGSWLHGDHLEIWLAPGALPDLKCEEELAARQWGVDLDGRVWTGAGDPDPAELSAQVTVSAPSARFAVQLPEGLRRRITVVYSDSDDGERQERLLATSTLVFAEAQSLGVVMPVASCSPASPRAPRR